MAAFTIGLLATIDPAFAQASLALTKTASPTTYTAAGQVITYTYVVTNDGTSDFDTFGFVDVDDDVIGSVCSLTLPFSVGDTQTCTATYTIVAADVTAGSVTNTAVATGNPCGEGECETIDSPPAVATVTFVGSPTWTLVKTANPTTYTGAGEAISYTYLLTNTGNVSISAISISDDKVSPVTCPASTLSVGASMTCMGSYSTIAADVAAGSVTNIATAIGSPAGGVLAPATDSATIAFVGSPAWTLVKTANPTTYSAAGQTIAYSYRLTNTGSVAISAISIDDDRVEVVACPASTLAVGANMTCTGRYSTTTTDVTAGSVTNTATATGTPATGVLAPASDSATITFAGSPSWTLAKTANPTTYSAAGQAIAYSYVLTNSGNVAIAAIAIDDDKVSRVACPSGTLATGASMTCTGRYSTTAGDVTAGSVTNTATATGTPLRGVLAPVTDRATIRFLPPASGSITIVKSAAGGDNTFTFMSSVPGTATFRLTTSGGNASRRFAGLRPATYTFTEVDLPLGWRLSDLTCAGEAGGTPTTINLADRSVSVGLDGGEAITCTFANTSDVVDETVEEIAGFLLDRLTLLDEGPDRTRIFRRMPGSLWGSTGSGSMTGGSGGPVAFAGSGDEAAMQVSFATSLAQISQAQANAAEAGEQLPVPDIDVWIEAHYSEFSNDADSRSSDGHFGITYLGADYLLTPSLLVGALAQFDWMDESTTRGGSAEGFGVMAGPYISARLAPNLFFTSRAAYGISENSIDPFGVYEDDFSTNRWLASVELTGNWQFGNWRVTPSAGVTYAEENQHSYEDSLGAAIPSQTVSVGRVSVGPEFAYRYLADSGTVWEPQVALTGLWDFDSAEGVDVGELVTTDDDLRAMVKAGVLAQLTGGASIRVVGTFDGIGGDGYESFGGQAWVSIPLR